MKTFISLIFAIVLILCTRKSIFCNVPEQKNGTGIIIQNARVFNPEISKVMRSVEHIIRTDSTNIFNLTVSFDEGATFVPIDFNQFTLLGKYASKDDCEVSYERNATRNDSQKKINYSIKVQHCGYCKKPYESMNWVLIPKIPDDYTVDFKVE